jgi:hypothetical protein
VAQTQPTRYTFKGNYLGESLVEFKANPENRPFKCYAVKEGTACQPRSEKGTGVGEFVLRDLTYEFYKDRLYRIFIKADAVNYADLASAFVEKYGPPREGAPTVTRTALEQPGRARC